MNNVMQRLAITLLGALATLASQAHAAVPAGWLVTGDKPNDYEYGTDANGAHDGGRAAYIKLKASSSAGFGTLMQMIQSRNYVGTRVRLSGYMRSAGVRRGQMWMRVDGPSGKILGFDNMDSRAVTGTTDWKRYEVVLDVPEDAKAIAFGFFLSGEGTLWADGFRLEIVDKTVPVTGGSQALGTEPRNLGFEE
jgi:hypothetical protein